MRMKDKPKKPEGHSLQEFEATEGQTKIREVTQELAVERAKVEALSDASGMVKVESRESCEISFGLISDVHAGSLYYHERALRGFYQYAEDQGIKDMYVAGDVLDGHKVYRGQEFELRDVGLDAQVKRLQESRPDTSIKSHFITGNHDQSFKVLAGAPVGSLIEAAVGWEFLGEEQASVEYQTPNGTFSLMLIHPGGGSSYALSYRLQKIIEQLEGGSKPDMLVAGHYHKSFKLPSYRNVCGIAAGTFQKQTPFMARGGLAAHLGGWLVRVSVGETHNVFTTTFVAFYV